MAWRGSNPATVAAHESLALFEMKWSNPHPETEIKSIDLIARHQEAAPFVAGLTVE